MEKLLLTIILCIILGLFFVAILYVNSLDKIEEKAKNNSL